MAEAYVNTGYASLDLSGPPEIRAVADAAEVALKGMTPGNIKCVQDWLLSEAQRAEAGE